MTRQNMIRFLMMCMLFGLMVVGFAPNTAQAMPPGLLIVVNTTADINIGTCDDPCSLRDAILLSNALGTDDTIHFNIPGGGVQTIDVLSPLPNITDSVVIDGTTQPGADCTSWPPQLMIELNGAGAGVSDGLQVMANDVTIRGLSIYGFSGHGIDLVSGDNTVVTCNLVGTDASGFVGIGNSMSGLAIGAGSNNNQIGGALETDRNLFSRNGDFGINIRSSSGNAVDNNFVGSDVDGLLPLANSDGGVFVMASGNLIGTTAGNVISGNMLHGVRITEDTSTNNVIQNNLIGVDVTGRAPLGNQAHGIFMEAPMNMIGGPAGTGNVIGSNGGDGIHFAGAVTFNNIIQSNLIGTSDTFGTHDLGNGLAGIRFDAAGPHVVGSLVGIDLGNTIAFNGREGVAVVDSVNITILGANSMFRNNLLGIDLAVDGVTANDFGDPDGGANFLQNYPIIHRVVSGAASTTFRVRLNSTPGNDYVLEFFSSPACDPSGHGEGTDFVGSIIVTTNGIGNASATVTFPVVTDPASAFTVTATGEGGNTSEFSACWES